MSSSGVGTKVFVVLFLVVYIGYAFTGIVNPGLVVRLSGRYRRAPGPGGLLATRLVCVVLLVAGVAFLVRALSA